MKNFIQNYGRFFDSYAEVKKLCVKNWENVIDYIDRPQIVYNNIIEAEKSER